MSVIDLLRVGIKQKLVEMAQEDKIPLDMNELDLDTIIDDILDSEEGENAIQFDRFCSLVSEEDVYEAWDRYRNTVDNSPIGEVVCLVEHMEDYSMWSLDTFHKHFIA